MSNQQYPGAPEADLAAPLTVGDEPARAVGARLAALRTEKGWSVEDISTRLKVPAAKLRLLEAGDLGRLPDLTFVLGIVRSYANMLGVDPAPLVSGLRSARGPVQPDLSLPASSGGGLRGGRVVMNWNGEPKRRGWPLWLGMVIVLVLAGVAWRNGSEAGGWLTRMKEAANSNATGASQAIASVANSASEATGASELTQAELPRPVNLTDASAAAQTLAAVSSNGAPASGATGGYTPQPLGIEGGNTTAAANNTNGNPVTTAAPASGTAAISVQPAAGQTAISFTMIHDSWVGVQQSDGKSVFSGTIKSGQPQQVVGSAPFKVVVGNRAGLGSMAFAGQPVDPGKYAAAKGNVARFSLP